MAKITITQGGTQVKVTVRLGAPVVGEGGEGDPTARTAALKAQETADAARTQAEANRIKNETQDARLAGLESAPAGVEKASNAQVDSVVATKTELSGIQAAAQASLDDVRFVTIRKAARLLQRVLKNASTTIRGAVLLARNADVDATETDTTRVLQVETAKRLIARVAGSGGGLTTSQVNTLIEAALDKLDIPEQRVLVDQIIGVVDKFDFVEHKPYTTRDRVIHEATPRSTTWTIYADSKYLGVIQSGEPTAPSARKLGNWFFHGRLHIPIRFESRTVDGTVTQDWFDTSIEQVIPNNFYIGDFPNDARATEHATGNDDIYYDYANRVLKQSSNFRNGTGRLTAPTRHRLLDTEDIDHTLATKDEIPTVPVLSGWDTVTVAPQGITDRDFPTTLDIVFGNKLASQDVKAVALVVAGQTATLSSATPISSLNAAGGRGVGVARFTYAALVATQIGNNLNVADEFVPLQVTVTYADDTSEQFYIPFLVNSPNIATGSGGEGGAGVDTTAREAAAAARAAIPDKAANTDVDGETDDADYMTVLKTFRAIARKVKNASNTVRGIVLLARNADVDSTETDTTRVLQVATGKRLVSRLIEGTRSAWDTVSVVPAGIPGDDFPTSLDIVFANKKKSKAVKAVSVVVSGQTAALSNATPISVLNSLAHGSGVLRFTYAENVADTIGGNIVATDEVLGIEVTVTYTDNATERFVIPFLVNAPALATSEGESGLAAVASDATLTGDGTSGSPLKVARPFTATDKNKLDGIEAGATADQTATEIRNLLQSLSGTNRLAASAIKDLPSGAAGTLEYAEFPINSGIQLPNPGSTPVALGFGAASRSKGSSISRAAGNASLTLAAGAYDIWVRQVVDRSDVRAFGHNRANARVQIINATTGAILDDQSHIGYWRGGEAADANEGAMSHHLLDLAADTTIAIRVGVAYRDSQNPEYTTDAGGTVTVANRVVGPKGNPGPAGSGVDSVARASAAAAQAAIPAKASNTDVDAETDDADYMTVLKTFRAIARKVKNASNTVRGIVLLARNADVDATETDLTRVLQVATAKRLIARLISGKQDKLPSLGAGQVRVGPSNTPTALPASGFNPSNLVFKGNVIWSNTSTFFDGGFDWPTDKTYLLLQANPKLNASSREDLHIILNPRITYELNATTPVAVSSAGSAFNDGNSLGIQIGPGIYLYLGRTSAGRALIGSNSDPSDAMPLVIMSF